MKCTGRVFVFAAGGLAFAAAMVPVSVRATGVALFGCRPPPDEERKMMMSFASALKTALVKNDRRRLRSFLSDRVLVRLDGKKQSVHWKTVDERFDEVFGPRVRGAVNEGRLTLGRSGWKLGKSVVFLGLAQHGKGCGLEVMSVFEEPPPTPDAAQPDVADVALAYALIHAAERQWRWADRALTEPRH